MKVWEAIELLKGMNPNKEVTVTLGPQPKYLPDSTPPATNPHYTPSWISPYYPRFNEVTCKDLGYKFMQ